MKNPEIILQRIDWTVIRRLDGLLQGDYRTLFHGFGLDLAELREYQYDDDVRYIDWNVTARLQTPYVRQYLEDRDMMAWFLLDLSPSIDFGTVNSLKRNVLIDFVIILARLLTRHGNRVGAILFSGKVDKVIPPQAGKLQVLRLIKELLDQPKMKVSFQTDLALLLEKANRLIRRHSLIFLVSDFISLPGWDKYLGSLTQAHEVLAIRLFDQREIELPDIGSVFFEDAETGEQLYIDTHDSGFRRRFTTAAKQRENNLDVIFNRLGVDILQLSTSDDLVKEIIRFAMLRNRKRKSPTVASKRNPVGFNLDSNIKRSPETKGG